MTQTRRCITRGRGILGHFSGCRERYYRRGERERTRHVARARGEPFSAKRSAESFPSAGRGQYRDLDYLGLLVVPEIVSPLQKNEIRRNRESPRDRLTSLPGGNRRPPFSLLNGRFFTRGRNEWTLFRRADTNGAVCLIFTTLSRLLRPWQSFRYFGPSLGMKREIQEDCGRCGNCI